MARAFTVGSLLGQPQGRAPRPRPGAPAGADAPRGAAAPPPALRGQGCCRSGCFGCPWADAVRRQAASPGP